MSTANVYQQNCVYLVLGLDQGKTGSVIPSRCCGTANNTIIIIQYNYNIIHQNIQKVISMYIFLKNLCLILVSNFILVAR